MSILVIAQYAAALTTIAGAVGLFVKWVVVKPIKAYIDQATYPISPGANGGRSLSDVAQTVNRIEQKQTDIEKRVVAIEELVTKPATRTKKSAN
jgi:hypothetical protein